MSLQPHRKRELYNHLRSKGVPRLTIKILLGYTPDGLDRMTILLGEGSEYDYRLLRDYEFRKTELKRLLEEKS